MVKFFKVTEISMSDMEFAWKITLSLVFIMPICVGGLAFGAYQLAYDYNINTALITGLGAFVGTFVGFIAVIALIRVGH